jgi:hypothetical protein
MVPVHLHPSGTGLCPLLASWLAYVIHPQWNYRLDADFEDHDDHEYAPSVTEHPEWEHEQFESAVVAHYRPVDTVADLFRQISYDEDSTGRRASSG